MRDQLSVVVGEDGVIVLAGEVDAFSAAALDEALADAIGREGDVVVDLRDVTFMDSGGLNAFIRHYKPLDAAGRRLVLRAPQHGVERALAVAGMMTVFEVEPA